MDPATKREFLTVLQSWTTRMSNLRSAHIEAMEDEQIEEMVATIVEENNKLDALFDKITDTDDGEEASDS
jgi:hypothetical protein